MGVKISCNKMIGLLIWKIISLSVAIGLFDFFKETTNFLLTHSLIYLPVLIYNYPIKDW